MQLVAPGQTIVSDVLAAHRLCIITSEDPDLARWCALELCVSALNKVPFGNHEYIHNRPHTSTATGWVDTGHLPVTDLEGKDVSSGYMPYMWNFVSTSSSPLNLQDPYTFSQMEMRLKDRATFLVIDDLAEYALTLSSVSVTNSHHLR